MSLELLLAISKFVSVLFCKVRDVLCYLLI
jgi:hypothetical protein